MGAKSSKQQKEYSRSKSKSKLKKGLQDQQQPPPPVEAVKIQSDVSEQDLNLYKLVQSEETPKIVIDDKSSGDMPEDKAEHDEKLQNELKVIDPNDLPKVPELPSNVPCQERTLAEELEQVVIELPKTPDVPVGDSPCITSTTNEVPQSPVVEDVQQEDDSKDPDFIQPGEPQPKQQDEPKAEESNAENIESSKETLNKNEANLLGIFSKPGDTLSVSGSKPPRPNKPNRVNSTLGKKIYNTLTRKKSKVTLSDEGSSSTVTASPIPSTSKPLLKKAGSEMSLKKPPRMDRSSDSVEDGNSSNQTADQSKPDEQYKINRPSKSSSKSSGDQKYNTVSMKISTFRRRLFNSDDEPEQQHESEKDSASEKTSKDKPLSEEEKQKRRFFNFEMRNFSANINKVSQVLVFTVPGGAFAPYAGPM